MTKPGGAAASTQTAFALGRELRACRLAAGLTPKELSALSHVPRTKIDALELGYYGADERKRAARLARAEIVRILCAPELGVSPEDANAFLYLAHESQALSGGELFHPLRTTEWPQARPAAEAAVRTHAAEIVRRHEAAFDARTGGAPPTAAPAGPQALSADWILPTQRCRRLYGRDALVAELREIVARQETPSLILVSGFPGVGKSELVRAALDDGRLRREFAGLRWISARQREFVSGANAASGDRGMRADDVLRDLARGLRTSVDELPRALSERRLLVVVDNAESIRDEDLLLSRLASMAGRSRVILTSRSHYRAAFVRAFPADGELPGLPFADAEAMLREESAANGTAAASAFARASDATIARVHEVTRGAPLALHWLLARAAQHAAPDAAAELAAGAVTDLYAFMFDTAWSRVTAPARDALGFLAFRASEPVPHGLLALAGCADGQLDAALAELREWSLVETTGEAFGLHPLTASFVRGALADRSPWSADTSGRAWRAGIRYLLEALHHDARGSAAERELGGLGNYLVWMRDAAAGGAPEDAIHVWLKFSRYLWENWHWDRFGACEEIGREAIEIFAATAPGAGAMLRALSITDLAYHLRERERVDESLAACAEAIATFDALDDDAGRSLAHRYAGLAHLRAGRTREARLSFDRALAAIESAKRRGFPAPGAKAAAAVAELARFTLWEPLRVGYSAYRSYWGPGEAELLSLVGGALLVEGKFADAIASLQRAIERYRECDDRWPGSEAGPLVTLARCYLGIGDSDAARQHLQRARKIAGQAGRRELEGGALIQLAELEANAGNQATAADHARAALEIATALGQTEEIRRAESIIQRR